MPRNGSGTFTPPSNSWFPAINGNAATSSDWNATLSDLSSGLTQSLSSDGQTAPVANLNMGTFRHTNVGDAVNRNEYPSVKQIQDGSLLRLTSISGSANAITASATPAVPTYSVGQSFIFYPTASNTGPVTININGNGNRTIYKDKNVPLSPGDLTPGGAVQIVYDSTNNFQISSWVASASGVASVVGTKGQNNSVNPGTRYDISCTYVCLKNLSGMGTISLSSGAVITCNILFFGANGRDQATAFTANNWINVYYIFNGTTLSTVASLRAPSLGPTMPAGYTHYAYATSVFLNASLALRQTYTDGNWCHIDPESQIMNGFRASAFTTIGVRQFVPPVSNTASAAMSLIGGNASALQFSLLFRATGSSGPGYAVGTCYTPASGTGASSCNPTIYVSDGGQIDMALSATPATGGASGVISGYLIPN